MKHRGLGHAPPPPATPIPDWREGPDVVLWLFVSPGTFKLRHPHLLGVPNVCDTTCGYPGIYRVPSCVWIPPTAAAEALQKAGET